MRASHQHSNCMPKGIELNNPLNIRKSENTWKGRVSPGRDSQFEEFHDKIWCYRAGFCIMLSYFKRGLHTIHSIINTWAPPKENNTVAYVQFVSTYVGIGKFEVIDFFNKKLMCKIMSAMVQMEVGLTGEDKTIAEAYDIMCKDKFKM